MDNRIDMLKIADAVFNKTKVLLLRVAAHANVLTSDNFPISSDYFGITRELLGKSIMVKLCLCKRRPEISS